MSFCERFLSVVGNDSQQKIADNTGMSRQTVNRLLNGKNEPTVENIKKIAAAYHCSADYLLEVEKTEYTYSDFLSMVNYLVQNGSARLEQAQFIDLPLTADNEKHVTQYTFAFRDDRLEHLVYEFYRVYAFSFLADRTDSDLETGKELFAAWYKRTLEECNNPIKETVFPFD